MISRMRSCGTTGGFGERVCAINLEESLVERNYRQVEHRGQMESRHEPPEEQYRFGYGQLSPTRPWYPTKGFILDREGGHVTGIAFEIEIAECAGSNSPIPKRVLQRWQDTVDNKARSPTSLEEIEAKLKEADSRRQQFHEWLVNKARPRQRTLPASPQHEDLAQRLEARLSAAEQKRSEILAQEQMRLAKLHELRVAAKTEAQLRAEREREELDLRIESRVQQAETNRLALLEAEKQRRAVAHERIAQSLLHRSNQEGREKERTEAMRAALCQKIAAAEEKRAGLLEAEKSRAQAAVLQARTVARTVLRERELELRRKREKLEDRLQRAKRQRAEFLRQRGGCRGACHNHGHKLHKHGDQLCRQLTRCWRQFRRSRSTTYALAQDYAACAINLESVPALPFEQLADRITAPATLRSVKALLERIESRVMVSCTSQVTTLDHLLKRLATPVRARPASRRSIPAGGLNGAAKEGGRSQSVPAPSRVKDSQLTQEKELERYPARVFLCAYMICGQPEAVFSTKGDREVALAEAAAKLLPEFESLVSTIIDGPLGSQLLASSPSLASDMKLDISSSTQESRASIFRPFAAQLLSFDTAWCAYLYQFVAWKTKDARALEEDLTRMACQLEISMLQKCRTAEEMDTSDLSHDSQAIRKQVAEDQKLLRDRIIRLTGAAGAGRMEEALADARNKYIEARENGTPLPSPLASWLSPSPTPDPLSPQKDSEPAVLKPRGRVVRSLFKSTKKNEGSVQASMEELLRDHAVHIKGTGLTNEKIVNEMLHDPSWALSLETTQQLKATPIPSTLSSKVVEVEAQMRSTMERAFWDTIAEGLTQSPPQYERVVGLVAEVRQELEEFVPEGWKAELRDCMDLELLAQILESGSNDFNYLRRLFDYASGIILKLGAPIRDTEAKAAHQHLVDDLSAGGSTHGQDGFANALVKGLRFIFERLQVLKQDINCTRLRGLANLINGPAGIEYMRKAFIERLQITLPQPIISVADSFALGVSTSLPRTAAWILEAELSVANARSEVETALAAAQVAGVTPTSVSPSPSTTGVPPVSSMRTGGRVGGVSINQMVHPSFSNAAEGQKKVDWRSVDTIVRLGLLQIICKAEGTTEETLPETLCLNAGRIRESQAELQSIIVTATGLLLVRQGLSGRGIHGAEVEKILNAGQKELEILLHQPGATIGQIGAMLARLSSPNATEVEKAADNVTACEELMTRVLGRSLSATDPVFARVSAAVRSSVWVILSLGKGSAAVAGAEFALKRIGGSFLINNVMRAVDAIEKIAGLTCKVHEPWYTACIQAASVI